MARPIIAIVTTASVLLFAGACDQKENPYALKPSKTVDMHKLKVEMTEEELAEARKAAGHPSSEELARENAEMFEKEAREYIKARLPEYRTLLTDLRGYLDAIEKQAPKWKSDAAFAKYNEKYKKQVKEFLEGYDELTGDGVEGGNTQADLSAAVRAWEQLNADIGPGVADNEALPGALKEIRDRLDKVTTSLDAIEKDETLEVPEPDPAAKK